MFVYSSQFPFFTSGQMSHTLGNNLSQKLPVNETDLTHSEPESHTGLAGPFFHEGALSGMWPCTSSRTVAFSQGEGTGYQGPALPAVAAFVPGLESAMKVTPGHTGQPGSTCGTKRANRVNLVSVWPVLHSGSPLCCPCISGSPPPPIPPLLLSWLLSKSSRSFWFPCFLFPSCLTKA